MLDVANSPEFHDVSPRQIVPTLTDRDMYYASESAFYRILHKGGLLHHRARSRPPTSRPRALTATGPDQVYSWDITHLRSRVRGVYFYLYLVVDIWSRRIVGWAIHDVESGDLAAALVEIICAANPRRDNVLWLHSDNGAAMKSVPLLAKLKALDISCLGRSLRRFVQYEAPAQRDQLRHPRRPTLRPSLQDPLGPQPRLRSRPPPPPRALVRKDPQLGTRPRRLP